MITARFVGLAGFLSMLVACTIEAPPPANEPDESASNSSTSKKSSKSSSSTSRGAKDDDAADTKPNNAGDDDDDNAGNSGNAGNTGNTGNTGNEGGAKVCVEKGAPGNEKGIGAYCDKTVRCKKGLICTADFGAEPGDQFCTIPCQADADCGSGAQCFAGDDRGKGCLPDACVPE
jgi:hypothetical protein